MSGRVTVKVLKRDAGKIKAPTSIPARPLPEPIEQHQTTYNKARDRIFAQRSSDPVKASGTVTMTNPWAVLADTPEQTVMGSQSEADAVLAHSDTVNNGDVGTPVAKKTGLSPVSKTQSSKMRRKRRFTQKQMYQFWLQEIQLVTVCMPESRAENTKRLEEDVSGEQRHPRDR